MKEGSIRMPVEVIQQGDSTYLDVQVNDIKQTSVYKEVLTELVTSKQNVKDVIILSASYISVLLVITIMVYKVNITWNNLVKRTNKHREHKLKIYYIIDRLYTYWSLWAVFLFVDACLMFIWGLKMPYLILGLVLITVYGVIRRIFRINKEKGYHDDELEQDVKNFLKDTIITPVNRKIQSEIEREKQNDNFYEED